MNLMDDDLTRVATEELHDEWKVLVKMPQDDLIEYGLWDRLEAIEQELYGRDEL